MCWSYKMRLFWLLIIFFPQKVGAMLLMYFYNFKIINIEQNECPT